MTRNLLSSLPRSAARLPRMAPDVGRLPAGRIVTLTDDVTTRLYDTGEDHLTPVVLLHGMAATGMLNWYQTFQRLKGEYRLITYDQRRHGMGDGGRFDFDSLSEDVLRVADHLELDRPVIGGYSMGGIVAQLTARRDPSRLGGLVLAATGTGAQRNALERITLGSLTRGAPALNAVPVEVARQIDDEVPGAYTWAIRELASVPLATHRTVIAEVARFNSTSWLHELDLPVAIIKTMRDIAFPRWIQDEMADLLPHSAVFPISAGHAACATHPGRFARRMRTALGWVVSNRH
ncbi:MULTISPECIES: alpha/beta fold hydrolase [unclassified Dietzia]|uniref:alpha/beta fold hydrolase n=1 Tax=unclassified Dietzia TaxID=2617939 RepID=UPI0013175B1D|nr:MULTISPECIES: alpha/beta hydrolase [unclassified Dietzia]QGW26156.1 alpha/beta hydrolase [Dietzia sp. DQ12-45-1b]